MDDLTVLIIPFESWNAQMEELCAKGAHVETTSVRSPADLEALKTRAEDWKGQVREVLRSSFSDSGFVEQFDESDRELNVPGFRGRNSPMILGGEAKKVTDRMKARIQVLKGFVKIVSVSELIRGEAVDLESRKRFTVRQKKDFLLKKLLELDNGLYHGLNILFVGNGVPVRDFEQVVEIASALQQEGYIDTIGGSGAGILGKITLEGQQYIEEVLTSYTEDYSGGPKGQSELAEKIEMIKDILDQQGLHHKLLFEEMEELKELFSKMDKKSFGQLLKGKLLDLVLEKVISIETATMIFTALFGHSLKLLS
jgi:hypothetical protein